MSNEIIEVVPWGLHPLPKWVITELENRSKEYDQNPVNINSPTIYSGPKTAWARVFSNGVSKHPSAKDMDGFVLGGVYGFENSYGFNDDKVTIGVDAKGNPHKIANDRSNVIGVDRIEKTRMDFPHRPPPSLDSLSVETAGTSQTFPGLCRKIIIKWKCYSLAQLNYMIPYFLTPRITCVVEWGWNHYDPISLVDLTDLDWINEMFVNPEYSLKWIKESKGNYDVGLGFIVDYGYSVNDDGSYDCSTTILNANRLIEGEQINDKQTFKKKGESQIPVKGFKEFIEKNLSSIDSNSSEYVKLRKRYQIGEKTINQNTGKIINVRDNVKERVFRISTKIEALSVNTEGFWIRMDLLEDIINSFFQITMKGQKEADIRKFDISQTRMVGNPLLKSSDPNVLVPNQYAPRFTYQETSNVEPSPRFENNIFETLFKEKLNTISKEYPISNKFDNLREVINPFGNSFPIYSDKNIQNEDEELSQSLRSGYWGNLKDLFINVDYFKDIVKNNDSLLRILEQLLQGINESLCQICQLRLIPAQYGNSIYSVYDENLPGITSVEDAKNVPKITLGAIASAYMKSAKFDVKISQEMMNQLVFQSANPEQDTDGSITSKTTKANPIVSRYSAGDRLYLKGELKTAAESEDLTGLSPEERRQVEQERREEQEAENARRIEEQNQAEEERKKKEQARSEKNKEAFWIYYKFNKKYIICEKTKDFMNYVLTLPNSKSPYLNNGIMPNTKLTIELQGISGIDYLSQFVIDHAPEAYGFESAIWQISDIQQTVEDKNWTTTIVAQPRPLTTI